MKLPDAVLHRVTDNVAFRASAAAYLVLDCDLHIRAVNHAYERATLHRGSDMIGEDMFEVFPDNPDTPLVRSVANLERSLDWVLRRGGPNSMGLQRYDVLDPSTDAFVNRSWLPINSPICDADGRMVAILHHVEDVTSLTATTSLELWLSAPAGTPPAEADLSALREVVERVCRDARSRQLRTEASLARAVRAIERATRALSTSDFTAGRHD